VVEGTPLLRVQTGNCLEGSNPFVSAKPISQAIEMYIRLSVENRSTHILPHNLAQIPPRIPFCFPGPAITGRSLGSEGTDHGRSTQLPDRRR